MKFNIRMPKHIPLTAVGILFFLSFAGSVWGLHIALDWFPSFIAGGIITGALWTIIVNDFDYGDE